MARLPDLEAWAVFAKVAEAGSFARAAQELGLAQATVSKLVTRLEQRLKTTLFHRNSRRLSLTAAGQASLERAARILAEGEAVEDEVSEQARQLRGVVRVAAPMSFGIDHLAPVLPQFMSLHPEVLLDLHFSDELIDVVAQGFDLALRISLLPDSSLLARRLCTVRLLVVGAPAYFERQGRPVHPRDLGHHRALRYAQSRLGEAWRFRHPTLGEFSQIVPTALRANNADALVPALLAGHGVALQPEFLAWADLQAGRLQAVLEDWQVPPIALHIVTPPGRARPARVQALIEFLAGHFARVPWAHPAERAA